MRVKRHFRSKRTVGILVGVIVLICLILWAIASFPGTANPGFQEYKPAILPINLRITDSELYIERYPQLLWPKFNKYLNLDFNQANSWVTESKSDGKAFYDNWCQSYNPGSTCKEYQADSGQKYLLSTVTNSSSQLNQEAYFIKDRTSIRVILTGYSSLSEEEWGKIIDGFQPTQYNHPRISRTSTEGP